MSSTFRDHFSGHAADYAANRPTYPEAMFEHLAKLVPERHRAWDCATGNGQAAVALARWFDEVAATDASISQLENAQPDPRVTYRPAAAENSELESDSVDLITVAQALHWFDFDRFYAEVKRVGKEGGVLAVWTYELAQVSPEVDELIKEFYKRAIGKYWPQERGHIESGYADILFPFEPIEVPTFHMSVHWTAEDMLAYLKTWSAVRRFLAAEGRDPVDDFEKPLRSAWGRGAQEVIWPLITKVGRIQT